MRTTMKLGAALLCAASMAGCVVAPPQHHAYQGQPAPQAPVSQYGYVNSIDLVRAGAQTSGGGAIIGGVVGAVIGNQIGRGGGRTAATAVGAIGGALAGNAIEQQNARTQDFYRVVIVLNEGGQRTFDYATLNDLRVGDRVRIDGNQVFRY